MPNFAAISQTVAGDFLIFHDGGRRHLGFLKFRSFKGRKGQETKCITMPNFTAVARIVADAER